MYTLIRPILFLLSAENAHKVSFSVIKFLFKFEFIQKFFKKLYVVEDPSLEREVFGLKFKNPVGIAAGFDKDAKLIDELSCLGFGFIEIGTLTPRPQEGNEKPRLFRLTCDEAIINRMGFNNEGVQVAIESLKTRNSTLLVGGNIGKNKITPNEKAFDDYLFAFKALYPYVDYFVVNVSSPNTPNLRDLQEKEPLKELLKGLMVANLKKDEPKPILLKIAPDLTNEQLDDIVEIVLETSIDGVIATNTTVKRDGLKSNWKEVNEIGSGGLSGKPLTKRSTEIIRYLASKFNGKIPIIGVGGIMTPEDALEKIDAGAALIQIYTGFIYKGPSLVKQINNAILQASKAK